MDDAYTDSAKTGCIDVHCEVVDAAHGRIDPAAALDFVGDPAFGGTTLFLGRIRDFNRGRDVTGISYDLFDPLALTLFREAADTAARDVNAPLKVYVAHAKGRLAVGDIAVVVAAGTPHRDEAFRACRSVIEAVKHRAPIWKQEHYVDGDSTWSEGCSLCTHEHDAGDAHDHRP